MSGNFHLYFFDREEFVRPHEEGAETECWFDAMDPRLLVLLDAFRSHINQPVEISPAPGALGRRRGDASTQHNVDRWGQVRAADLMLGWLTSRKAVVESVETLSRIGITGIGIYPHWSPQPGIHVDTRRDRKPNAPALWGGVKVRDGQKYVSYREALMEWDD